MYEAKSTERDFVPYTEQIGTRYHRELELSIRLNKAIHNKDQFHLVYQPKFHTATNEVAGVEAMLRWDEPELGTISPEEFIPIAEKHRIILPIGRWVIKAACKQLHHWQSEGRFLPGRMALNISVQQFEHPDFFEDLIKMIADEGLSPSIFELEMTESIFISNPEKTMQVLKKLEHVGFCIAIDDFGTGFSSLSYLKKINAQILKIDKSFIDSLATSIHDKVIVKSVVDLAQNLGLAVVAEGVETEQQKRYLEEIGCDMIQGYYYLKPVTADELIRRIPFKVLPNG
nr:EAL domain-containing protein [Vibrio crassostreae]